MRSFVVAAWIACLCFGGSALAQARFDFATTPGRLAKQVVPSRYALEFDLDPARDTFGGRAAITLRVHAAVDSVTLHAHELKARGATLVGVGGSRALRVTPDDKAMTWRLTPRDGKGIAAGEYTLRIAYGGIVHRTGEGLYRVDYKAGGQAQRWLATQLEEISARTLFPGFDEPAFRAVFDITVRAPRGLDVVSNMPRIEQRREGATTLHRFAATPAMPSYLVALAVGRFDPIEGVAAGVPLRILAAPGKSAQARYAMDVTRQLLPYYNDYFGLPYALPKLDQLAVPGVRDGAMEDWGLISYTESALLVDPATSGPRTEREVFAVIAHEVSHQWFGNLVTASFWDEIWLNEAFATWMEKKASEHFNPQWQVPLNARRRIDRSMLRDGGQATRAIRSGPVDETKVTDQFDDITYTKGGAVLSMLEQWLGPDVFQRGLASYMRERKYSNATAGDLWFHLSRASGRDVAAVTSTWTDQPGFPLVQLSENCVDGRSVLRLTQRRFELDGALPAQQWKIPLRLARGTHVMTMLLEAPESHVEFGACSDEPVVGNAGGRGFYRVAYDAAQLRRLTARFGQLAPTERVSLLSDSFALAQAGQLPMSAYFALLAKVSDVHDVDRAALFEMADAGLVFLDDSLAGTPAQAQVRAEARALFAPELARLGWQPRQDDDAETLS
ncbi:MAG TPA: M1 family metallopeptidase, partial [Albitalea sp.]|nr:M1 family metallopeptidase [Albitalea sp.]